MPDEPRYLIGFGERLTRRVHVPSGGGSSDGPYTIEQARARLGRMTRAASETASSLPAIACPDDRIVMAITLHPKYLSKSAYPQGLFEEIDVTAIGSRPVKVVPELAVRVRGGESEVYEPTDPQSTTRIFVDSLRVKVS